MKTNIKVVDTNNNPINPTDKHTLRWYKWKEYCDDCGKPTPNSDLFHSNVPDLNENDYCYKCSQKRLIEKRGRLQCKARNSSKFTSFWRIVK